MELKERIEIFRTEEARLINKLDETRKLIIQYQNLTTITNPLLVLELGEIESLKICATKGFEINIYQGKYRFILGGDGRSQPWDEQRQGVICDIKSRYYLNQVQINIITSYLKSLGQIDDINFNQFKN
jgi:hypothetical protein